MGEASRESLDAARGARTHACRLDTGVETPPRGSFISSSPFCPSCLCPSWLLFLPLWEERPSWLPSLEEPSSQPFWEQPSSLPSWARLSWEPPSWLPPSSSQEQPPSSWQGQPASAARRRPSREARLASSPTRPSSRVSSRARPRGGRPHAGRRGCGRNNDRLCHNQDFFNFIVVVDPVVAEIVFHVDVSLLVVVVDFVVIDRESILQHSVCLLKMSASRRA